MATPCITRVQRASGIDPKDAAEVVRQAQAQYRAAVGAGQEPNTAMRAWNEGRSVDLARRKEIQKRQAAYNAMKRVELARKLTNEFFGKEDEGVEAFLMGTASHENSIAGTQRNLASEWRGALMADLHKAGPELQDIFVSGAIDRDIAMAMHAIGRGLPTEKIDANAVEIAKVLRKHNDAMRENLNRHGADVGYIEDFIFSQVHEQGKISRAGKDAWIADVTQRLDWERTFGWSRKESSASPHLQELEAEILEEWYYSLATGNHARVGDIGLTGKMTGVGAGNMAKRVSQERSIHFKDGAAFYEYQQKYGTKKLSDGINAAVATTARSTAVLQYAGPGWASNIDAVVNDISASIKQSNPKMSERLVSEGFRNHVRRMKSTIDGSINVPESPGLHNFFHGWRVLNGLRLLGSAVLSAVVDPISAGAEASAQYGRYFGKKSYLGSVLSATKGALSYGKTRADQVRIASRIGVALDVLRGTAFNEFGAVESGKGFMSAAMNAFSKWTGLGPWTNGARAGTACYFAQNLADFAGKPLSALDAGEQRAMKMAGVGEKEWALSHYMVETDTINQTKVSMLAPERVDAIPDDVMRAYIGEQNASDAKIAIARDKVKAAYMAYYASSIDSAIIEVSPRTRAKMRNVVGDAKAGTLAGEAWMSVLQFKSFPTAYIAQRVTRDFRLRGVETWSDLYHKPGAWAPHMAFNMVAMLGMGYVAMTLKDLAKGREPRSPDNPKTWIAAAVQGGGAGIYGDFLFGEMQSRFGQGPLTTLLGPSAGSINDALILAGAIKDPLMAGEEISDSIPSRALKFAYNHTPFINMFYSRLAVDYWFMWRVMEEMNPGYQARMRRGMKQSTGQEMLFEMPGGF